MQCLLVGAAFLFVECELLLRHQHRTVLSADEDMLDDLFPSDRIIGKAEAGQVAGKQIANGEAFALIHAADESKQRERKSIDR